MKYRKQAVLLQLGTVIFLIFVGLSLPYVYYKLLGSTSAAPSRVVQRQSAIELRSNSPPVIKAAPPEIAQGVAPVKAKEQQPPRPTKSKSSNGIESAMELPPPRVKEATTFNFDKTVKEVMKRELKAEITAKGNELGGNDLLDKISNNKVTFVHGDLGENCHQVCSKIDLHCGSSWYIRMNKCSVLRDIFPEARTCAEHFFGRDLPAYRPSDNVAMMNSKPSAYYPSCGISHALTERPCGCEESEKLDPVTYHTVFNCQPSKFFEWQARYSYFWFKQVQQPGKWTRLLSAGGPDHLMDELPTHVAPAWDMSVDAYTPYNKPQALAHWLANVDVKEDVIILLDPDCMFIEKCELPVKEGFPIGNAGFYNFPDDDPESVETEICRRYCPHCKWFDPIAVPVIIHTNDAKKLAPLWLNLTITIRNDRDKWPANYTDNSKSVNSLSWVAEMYAYVIAAAMLGLRHEIYDLQGVPGVHKQTPAPFIHYHISANIGDFQWNKGNADAATNFPWPITKEMKDWDPLKARFFRGLHDALETVGKSTYQWPPNLGWRDPES